MFVLPDRKEVLRYFSSTETCQYVWMSISQDVKSKISGAEEKNAETVLRGVTLAGPGFIIVAVSRTSFFVEGMEK